MLVPAMATLFRSWTRYAFAGAAVIVALSIAGVVAQQNVEWPNITGGYSATRYAAVDQINASNFNTLKVAWEWRGEVPPGVELGDINARGLPIYVDNLLYTTSGPRRTVVALDPDTGSVVWSTSEGHKSTADRSSPAVKADGTIYFGARDNDLWSVQPNGTTNWRFSVRTDGDVSTSPTIGPDGTMTDGLDTAIFVLGAEKGLELIEAYPEYETIIVDATGKVWYSKGLVPPSDGAG